MLLDVDWVLLDAVGCCRVLMDVIGCCWDVGCCWLSLGFVRGYWMLLGVIGMLLGAVGCCVWCC